MISAIAEKSDISKKSAGDALNVILESITDTLAKGDSLSITGFGAFSTSHRAARVGRNPQTGEEIQIKESTLPKFTAGKNLKEAVN